MPRRPLVAAALCAALAAVVYALATHVAAAQHADTRVLDAFMAEGDTPGAGFAAPIFHAFDPPAFAVMLLALVTGALLGGRRRAAIIVGASVLGATLTAELLKLALAAPRPVHTHSWPSGHTTAVMSLVLAVVLLSPPRWRWLAAAAGGALTVAVVFSILILGSHYPSDVVGGFLVAAGFNCLAAAALRVEALPSLRTLVAGPALGAAAVALVLATHPHETLDYAAANTTFVAGALALAAGALLLSGSVPAPTAARRPRPPG